MKRALIASLGALALAGLVWSASVPSAARKELLAIRSSITPGMERATVLRLFAEKAKHATIAGGTGESSIEVVSEGGSPVQWALVVSFQSDRAVAVRIGTQDSLFEHPTDAPPHLVWGPDPPDSPWGARH